MFKNFNKKSKNGFTLVEVLVSLAGIITVMLGVYGLSSFAFKITTNNKFIVAATSLANRKMEQTRNISYIDIGTVGGIPTGIIPDDETIYDRSGKFNVNTFIQYVDDPFDGISGGSPDDTLPTDYKTIRIRVSWDGPFGIDNVETFSQIAPKGMETNVGGGILSILVFDANGVPIENADIHIENNILATPISIDAQTNANGRLDFPGATSSVEGYEILATKPGYSTSSTSPRTIENPNPTIPHATIIEGVKTEISFTIDILSNLTIKTVTADLPDNWVVSDDTEGNNQENSRIAFDSTGNIYVVWQDDRNGSDPNIFAQKYDDDGNSIWADDQKISTANGTIVPDILVDSGGNLYISWYDNSTGNKEAYLVKRDSSDGSDLWGAEKKINTLADADNQSHPLITLTDNGSNATTTVIWQDDRNSDIDIYLQIFDSTGDYQLSPEIRVNSNTISDGTNQYNADIKSDNNENIIVAWTDDRNGNLDIYAELFSSITISQWEKLLVLEVSNADQYSPSIAIDSLNNFYVVWTDERSGDKNIYVQKFDINGNSIWASEIEVNTDGGSSEQYSPSIAIDGLDNIYITWTDTRNANMDIYAQKMLTDGTISWTDDVRVNIDTTNSNQYNSQVVINPTNDVPFVTWQSDINGDENIFVSSFGVYINEQNLANIDIIVTGQKKIGESPIIYKYNKTYASNGTGDIFLNNIEWDSYNFEATNTTYSIILSEPSMPISLEPNTTASIKLYLDN